MDQVAALHWIQENIAEFGGQPTNVTIIGHGYGAACAHLLMISPMAKGLICHCLMWFIALPTIEILLMINCININSYSYPCRY